MVPLHEGFSCQIKERKRAKIKCLYLLQLHYIKQSNGPMAGLGISDKLLIFISVKEIVLYTGKSTLGAPLI